MNQGLGTVFFYIVPFVLSFGLSFVLTPIIRKLAFKWQVVDVQNEPRKTHPTGMIPELGGWAVVISFLVIGGIAWVFGWLTDVRINHLQIIGIFVGALLLALHGFIDDKYNLKALHLFMIPTFVSFIVVWFGVRVGYVTNLFESGIGPFGLSLFYFTPLVGVIFSFLWILGMMYTVKFLDGLDGLVAGVGFIGAVILFVVSLFWDVPLSGTSILALILAGSLLGFLPYNWHPAKIFLGESSMFVGFMLGVLSIISGAKIATALLIMGIPILDVVWVIFRRIFYERHSPFLADRKHLHFRLLDMGLSHKKTVMLLYFLTAFFGSISIFLQSKQKVVALVSLGMVMIGLVTLVLVRYHRQEVIGNDKDIV